VVWEEEDAGRGEKVLLALPNFSYLLVVDRRGQYVLPWTACPVEQSHAHRKLLARSRRAMTPKS
jgi:hypothetical protein